MAILMNDAQTILEEQLEMVRCADRAISECLDHLSHMKGKSDEALLMAGAETDLVSKAIQDAYILGNDIQQLQILYRKCLDMLSQPEVYAPPEAYGIFRD